MRKLLFHCLLWSMPALAQGAAAAGKHQVLSDNAAAAPRVLASSALLASDRSASAIDCRLPAAQQAGPPGPADSAQAIGAASRGAGGDAADVAAYVRLHRQARTAIPFEWRPLGHCVSP